ncbi:sigma-54-dependent Fis family transcriptional regulator [Prosthecochloris sp. N3]|uniref:Sigma-54-dependent Fis family transcriptional regulator n=2 Tax=Prosthecochloris ethylica TaxID=2743976 RepID=A0ABR9XPW1_9CHLB|nr:sigma-54 dependent transcriptional regulator [Prosthecochloris ethylica]MBF0586140.1 sigma-54-dependent Fis family transcriptional regulator [Prosthecochloris ethylica]MBF0635846.1 sigma-54-dependent Fis family transcriptional regulator [Prosthecochloris ethylica]
MRARTTETTVLIADDSAVMRTLINHIIQRLGYRSMVAEDGIECIKKLEEHKIDVLLLDINMPGKSGIEVLSYIREQEMSVPVIMITALDDISQAVQCIKMGAYEYLTKPVEKDRLEITVKNALSELSLRKKVQRLEKELVQKDIFRKILGESPALKTCIDQAMHVMETDVNVLINGESGTGKELFAQAIHHGSKRSKGPFVTINCAAITNELADSLLFGHVKGSFTGANNDHTGFFEQADGGTIFLDEIGDMSLEIQAKVLRVLQERIVRKVGEKKERPVDFRLISATHKDFTDEIENGSFRADLYYRLEEYPLYIPPLRERREDIALLARHFLESFCTANNIEPLSFSESVLEELTAYDWPGNIRELQNVVRRSAINRRGSDITSLPGQLHHAAPLQKTTAQNDAPQPPSEHRTHEQPTKASEHAPEDPAAETSLRDAELHAITRAYTSCGGNQTRTAKVLGISRSSLYRKLKKYGIEKNITLSVKHES